MRLNNTKGVSRTRKSKDRWYNKQNKKGQKDKQCSRKKYWLRLRNTRYTLWNHWQYCLSIHNQIQFDLHMWWPLLNGQFFSLPVIDNFLWIEPLLRGDLSYKATFSLYQRWHLNTGLTVHIVYTLIIMSCCWYVYYICL